LEAHKIFRYPFANYHIKTDVPVLAILTASGHFIKGSLRFQQSWNINDPILQENNSLNECIILLKPPAAHFNPCLSTRNLTSLNISP
jgi:hypothetical protein